MGLRWESCAAGPWTKAVPRFLMAGLDESDSLFNHINLLAAHGGKWMHNYTVPISQGGPEVKYLLQGGMSGKESLLAKPFRPLCTLLAWRSLS